MKMMSKIRQPAYAHPKPLRPLDLPFQLEYVLLRSFGLSPFQISFAIWLGT
jgi:hypothetical protein